jgi:alkane 1-monooxygenase
MWPGDIEWREVIGGVSSLAMTVQGLRYFLGTLLLVAAILAIVAGGWPILAVAAIIFIAGAPADEALGDDHARFSDAQRAFFDFNIYATLPLLALMTLAMLYGVALQFGGAGATAQGHGELVATVLLTGYCYALFGATVGHELVHRTGNRAAQWSARALFAFTFNTGFTTFHIHGHHRQVGTARDPATARRGEYILSFVVRTTIGQFMHALRFEAGRARRRGQRPYGFGNKVVTGQLYSLALIVFSGAVAGWPGAVAFIAAGLIGRFFHELVNYVQHFGLVRVEGAPIEQRHSWDSYRFLSNALQYNLPLHADHHMFASKPFWQLSEAAAAPTLPHGYQTMVFVALVPAWWRRTMAPLLADWDARLADEAERAVIRECGWAGLC